MHGEKNNRNNNGIDTGKTAIAIEYVPGEAAPKILATGKGIVADRIIERAKESNVPTYKDDKLADTLSKLKIGDMISPRKNILYPHPLLLYLSLHSDFCNCE